MNHFRNPYSGRNSAGPRFRFRVRSIARRNLYLPLEMKSLPDIKRLLAGVSPLSVFNSKSLSEARQAIYELRKKYDFPFWVTLEYSVHDKDDSGRLVPLALNSYQSYVISTVRIPCVSKVAHFSSFQSSSFSWDRKNTGYVHHADMSKWFDPSAQLSYRIFSASIIPFP